MKGAWNMHRFEALLTMLDYSLDTKRKRHIAGGVLMSISLLFGGLAFTVMSLKTEDKTYE
jgi:hypothetical protein